MKSVLQSPFFKIYFSFLLFFLMMMTGTVGYMLIEDYTFIEAVYMTVITISTVGFTEVHPMDNAGRIFTSVLILFNISTFTYFLAQISAFFLDGEFARTYKFVKMKKAISELRGHVIICGFGRNGHEAARLIHNSGKDFVVVERKSSRKEGLSFPVNYAFENDATHDETLIEAGIEHAAALITTLPDDADNLYVTLTARELNPRLKIVSRASNDATVRKLKSAGASHVIMPDKMGGAHMATVVLSPDVEDFVNIISTQRNEHFSIHEIEARKTISLAQLDCWSKTGATILGLKTPDGEYAINPLPDTVLQPGYRLIVMGARDQLAKAEGLLS